ncbi:MAG: hypothetical protein WCZ87_03715 [Thiohalobacteraceae bacterium]
MLKKLCAGFMRQLRLLAVLTIVAMLGGTAGSYLLGGGDDRTDLAAVSGDSAPAWGDEMLAEVHKHVIAGLPVRVANACGLGASSCFRCHNGKRAPEPGTDPAKDPWHLHHKTVNNSCAGCHQGNPRLMKQDIAHSGLVANPRSQPATSCFTCHTSGDDQKLVDLYQKLPNNMGE